MNKVNIYKLQNDGTQVVIVSCYTKNGSAVCEGDADLIYNIEHEGITDYSQKGSGKLFPADGIHFLEQLKYNFKSAYLNASEIIEEQKQ